MVHTDVLVIRHWCAKAEVLDVEIKVAGSVFGFRDITVNVYFGI